MTFAEMNESQRKRRIKNLWRKVRFYVMTQGSFQQIMKIKEDKRRERFGLDTDRSEFLPEDQELEQQLVYEDDSISSSLPGYLINPDSQFYKVKQVWIQTITWTNLIITPIGFVFYKEMGESLHFIEWVVDIAWTVEILMSFFEAENNGNNKRITFKQTALWYL